MKGKKIIVPVIVIVLIVSAAVVGLLLFPKDEIIVDNVLRCNTVDEVEDFSIRNSIPYEKRENSIHLHNIEYGSNSGYCIIEFESSSQKVYRTDIYMILENDNFIDTIKNTFLNDFGFSGEYEYFPLDSSLDEVGEQDFLERRASKELFVHEEDATWNISWYITDEGVSTKISRVVFI